MKIIIVLPKEDDSINNFIKQLKNVEVLQEYIYFDDLTLQDIINTNPDVLVISEYVQGDGGFSLKEFINSIKTNTTIRVLLLTGGRGVGDKFLHEMVSIGVWDILDKDEFRLEQLSNLIYNQVHYKDVAKYHNPVMESAAHDIKNIFNKIKPPNSPKIEKPREIIKEVSKEVIKEIIKEVPVIREVAQPGLKDTIVFWSNCETGKTFISTNYAIALSQQPHTPKVLLIEGDFLGRNQYIQFKLPQNYMGIAEAVHCTSAKTLLKLMYQPKGLPNLHILALHPKKDLGKNDPSLLQHIQDYIREQFDYIIVDAGKNINDPFIKGAMRVATKVYIVTNLEWPKNFHLSEAITNLKQSKANFSKYRLIVNQFINGSEITAKDLESILAIPLVGVVPNGLHNYSDIINGLFNGTPLLLQNKPGSEHIRQAIESLIYSELYQTPPQVTTAKNAIKSLIPFINSN